MKTAAIILAAGAASRFGAPKQLLELDGQSLTQRAAHIAATVGCHPIIVVIGAYLDQLQETTFPEGVVLLQNPSWEKGMGTSLALGVSAAQKSGAEAALVLLADQPAINRDTLISLKEQFNPPHTTLVLCKHGENPYTLGPPTLIHATHFPEFLQLTGDTGGKEILRHHPEKTATINAPEAHWDIDEKEDWKRFSQRGMNR